MDAHEVPRKGKRPIFQAKKTRFCHLGIENTPWCAPYHHILYKNHVFDAPDTQNNVSCIDWHTGAILCVFSQHSTMGRPRVFSDQDRQECIQLFAQGLSRKEVKNTMNGTRCVATFFLENPCF